MIRKQHQYDFCVVGGGMAGMLAAVSAARHGVKTALVHDRPVLGGNASSEIRMHICGAHGANKRETGILEEILLENHYRNPLTNFSIWDSVLYGKAVYQENLDVFLNASVFSCEMCGNCISSVAAWQLTTETTHVIEANFFADCSGDGILAPLTGADCRIGREARAEYGETIGPAVADDKTMGMSCLLQAREYETVQPFIPPDWACRFTCAADLHERPVDVRKTNFWWIEVGGDMDSIHDTEVCREELVRIAFGVWDYLKNYSDLGDKYANWALDWVGFLPGKRESRRYIGDHVLTQHDIEAEGRFYDLVAYGGWTMDDHVPAGFHEVGVGTTLHPAPSPFGIPYRSLYSVNIENLFCAGRNHSATHAAMSATRVMGTTSLMGQAVGTAAALAVEHDLSPRGVYEQQIEELKLRLMEDDCYLPWHERPVPRLTARARFEASEGDPAPLRNGVDRPVGDADNGWWCAKDGWVGYHFAQPQCVRSVRIVFDSDLERMDTNRDIRARNMRHFYPLDADPWQVPPVMTRDFRVEIMSTDGQWQPVAHRTNNYDRLVRIQIDRKTTAVRLVCEDTWGAQRCHLFAFEVR